MKVDNFINKLNYFVAYKSGQITAKQKTRGHVRTGFDHKSVRISASIWFN